VVVQDANSCTASASVTINQPAATVTISSTPTVDVLCFGQATGTITVNAAGGTGTLTYSKDNGATFQPGNVFGGLVAGTYQIVVQDANSCTASASVTINQPAATVTISSTPTVDVLCFGQATGTITVNAAGGTGTLTYSKDNGATFQPGNVFGGLVAGTYQVVVQDANSCTASASVTINQPAATVTISSTPTVDVLCFGQATGTITVNAAGGTGTLTYSKDNGATFQPGNVFGGLVAGTYQIVVQDANSCTASASVTINQPAATVTISST